MNVPLEPVRGFRDITTPDSEALRRLSAIFAERAKTYGYEEVVPPTIERFELFAAKSGEEIRRSMFVFKDKAGREVALRPEATASVARIYLRLMRARPKPVRLFYVVNCFRYEEPQKGRYREFWQAGVELIGAKGLAADLEIIDLLISYYRDIGLLGSIALKLGSMEPYRILLARADEELQEHVLHLVDKGLHDKALEALEANGFRKEAATLREVWSSGSIEEASEKLKVKGWGSAAESLAYLGRIAEAVRSLYPELRVEVDLSFARGLAYYTGIIFEVKAQGLAVSIAGGGRYDGLVEVYGGEHTPGIGFAVGLDRTLLALKDKGIRIVEERPRIAVIVLDEGAIAFALRVRSLLSHKGYIAELEPAQRLSKALSKAYERGARYAAIIGLREAESKHVTVKDLETRRQVSVSIEELDDKGLTVLPAEGG